MSTLRAIIEGKGKSMSYEWFLYLFPQKRFFKEVTKISSKLGVNVWEGIKDELWVRGLVSERGEARMGKKMKKKITEAITIEPWEKKVKRGDMCERQAKGKEVLIEYGKQMGYLVLCSNPGLMMWNREKGILVNAGNSWCYVYRSGNSFRTDVQYPMIGYFQMGGSDVQGQLSRAVNGELMWSAYSHGVRRRLFLTRATNRGKRMNIKRKQA